MVLSLRLLHRSPRQNIRSRLLLPVPPRLQREGETRSKRPEPRLIGKDPPFYFDPALNRSTGLPGDDVATPLLQGRLPGNTDVGRCAKSRAFSGRLAVWVRSRSLYHSDRERTAILS